MVRRFVAILGALAVTLVGFVGIAGSAHAYVSNNGRCESGEVCMWQNADFLGGRYDTGNSTTNFNTVVYYRGTCTSNCTLNDTVSSLKNYDAGKKVRFFEHASMGGAYFNRAAANSSNNNDQAQNLTLDRLTNGAVANDQFSSFCFVYAGNPISTRCRQ
jgi:hypothetical protein